jgi:competence protein ComEA
VATLVLLALAAMAGYWFAHGGWRGELIEIEHAMPRQAHFRVDINQASWPEFAQLPGVGETLARRIVATRTRQGIFRDHRQLLEVPGIGPNTLDDIRPYLLPLPAAPPSGSANEKDG